MDKKRGYNIKYLLLFTSAAALLCALAAYISINDTYKYTRERAAFLAESYGSQTRYELMDLYDDAFVLRELIQQGMLDAKGTKIAVHEKGFRNMSELGIQRMNNVCTAFDDMALITNVSLAMAEGPLQDGIPEKTVISYCFPYEINKSALGKNLMIQPKRDDAIRKVYRKQGELVIEGPFRRIGALEAAGQCCALGVGAQDVSEHQHGAYTGEVSAEQLSDLGAQYCIVGHSERRSYHGETDLQVNAKTKILLENHIIPIICVGESLAQREHDLTETYVAYQVAAAFSGLTAEQAVRCVIAYEPLWAIGTGNTATSAQAQEVCASIRATLTKLYDADTAKAISILYGGSMNAGNAAELLAQPDIDGGLIGGASLKPVDFSKIIAATAQGACE